MQRCDSARPCVCTSGAAKLGLEKFDSAYVKLSIVLFEEEENRVPNQAPKPGRLPFKNFQQSLHGTVTDVKFR